jgi:lipid II:glycine glycyltransferase (peptidoglycan interpeptide bridge formation enzyme)
MPTYLAQWKAITHAKKIGCVDYDFGGIANDNKMYKGWEGLTAFKKKFGGREVRHSDFFDVVVQPFWYHLYNLRKLLKKFI